MTASAAKYIIKISEMQRVEGIKAVDIAKALGYSRASVCRMLYVLFFDGYIDKAESGEVSLTEKGERCATRLKCCTEILSEYLQNSFSCNENLAKADALNAVVNFSSATVEKIYKKKM